MLGASALLLALVTWLDFATGVELRLFPLYFVPVSFVSWSLGLPAGLVTAALATVGWEVSNRLAGFRYSAPWIEGTNVLAMAAAFTVVAVLIAAQRRQLEREQELARVDPLTGVANGRAFRELGEREVARSRRTGSPVSVAYLDLDGFKSVNDTLGHAVGDEVLSAVAARLREACRATDVVARLGGDEFALLLPDTDGPAAEAVVRKLRERVAALAAERRWPVSMSAGAVGSRSPQSLEQLLQAADALMYEVKTGGKDGFLVRHLPGAVEAPRI